MADPKNLILLLHGDGEPSSTTIVNDAQSISSVRILSSPSVSLTDEFVKFGTTSMTGLGGAKIVYDPTKLSSSFLSNPFTIDCFCYFKYYSWTNASCDLFLCYNATYTSMFELYTGNYRVPAVYLKSDGSSGTITSSITLGYDVWNHIACVKGSDNYIRLYINGVLAGTSSSAWPFSSPPSPMNFETDYWGAYNSYIDELRLIKEVLWTSNFDVPTEPMSLFTPSVQIQSDFVLKNKIYLGDVFLSKNQFLELIKIQNTFDVYTSLPPYQKNTKTFVIENAFVQQLRDCFTMKNQETVQTKDNFRLKNAVGFCVLKNTFIIKNNIDFSYIMFDDFVFDETYLGE
jgi:hypothetical protein